jgi:hypothetical protein
MSIIFPLSEAVKFTWCGKLYNLSMREVIKDGMD